MNDTNADAEEVPQSKTIAYHDEPDKKMTTTHYSMLKKETMSYANPARW